MDEVSVNYRRTINLGNYENVIIETGIKKEIKNNDLREYNEILDEIYATCEDFVLAKAEIEANEKVDY